MPKKTNSRSATRPDVQLGARIRIRRVEQRLSQSDLGKALGVSFQQIQKYEKGVNRVGASRLTQIAHVLKVPITFFYGGDGKDLEVDSLLFGDARFSLRLIRAYKKLPEDVGRQFVLLMEKTAGLGALIEAE